jgi:hypothetical protein
MGFARESLSMPTPNELPGAGLGLAAGICLIALFLGLREWYERRGRSRELSREDRGHFARQDLRRRFGVAVLFATAALVLFGSRIRPRSGGKPNLLFIGFWTAVLGLIVVMLVLSLFDWMATRAYARRHRKQIFRDSLREIRRGSQPPSPEQPSDHHPAASHRDGPTGSP